MILKASPANPQTYNQKHEYHQQQKESQPTPKISEKSEDKQVFQDTQMEILNAIKS